MEQITEGKKIHNWTVIEYKGKIKSRDVWLCRCVCGKEKIIQQRTLLNGESKSCGCKSAESKRNQLEGNKYGKLTVIDFAYTKNNRTFWKCVCDCGNQCIVMGKSLITGNTKSCGCERHKMRKDISGKRFGHLIAKEYKWVRKNHSVWLCLCDCGNTVEVGMYSLVSGNTTSCGCKHYPESDTLMLAKKFNKHKTTIMKVKKDLFGKYLYTLDSRQIEQMEDYFKHAKQRGNSSGEKNVFNYVKSIYEGEVIQNDREMISPKELDIYIPEKKFAIEYNGLIWHSERAGCTQFYHWNKTKMCLEKGIRLLHIYENEWRDKQDICKSMVASALGIYERKEFARNCEVKEVTDKKVVIDFFNENHIQGAVHNYSLCLGLYKDGQLLQAVVFGKQHFGKKGIIELYRMVTKKNTQVIGGFSKLMKHSPYDTVVSYVALRLFDAKGYLAGNWKIEHRSQPSFDITDGENLYTRHLFKKERCLKMFTNVTEDMTEREMQIKNGFYRIWDCGTYKVVWNRP